MSMPDRYLIWSFEHNSWWGLNERGYVRDWKEAGVYPRARAEEICESANFRPGVLNETFIPLHAIAAEE